MITCIDDCISTAALYIFIICNVLKIAIRFTSIHHSHADILNERLETVYKKDPRYDPAKKTLFQFEARPPEVGVWEVPSVVGSYFLLHNTWFLVCDFASFFLLLQHVWLLLCAVYTVFSFLVRK